MVAACTRHTSHPMYTYCSSRSGKTLFFHGTTLKVEVPYRHVNVNREPGPFQPEHVESADTVWMHGWDGAALAPILAHAADFRTLVLDIDDAAHFPAFETLVQALFADTKVRTVVAALHDPEIAATKFPTCVLVPRVHPGLSVHVMTPSTQFEMDLVLMGPGTVRCPLPLVRPEEDEDTPADRMDEYQDHYPDVNKYRMYPIIVPP